MSGTSAYQSERLGGLKLPRMEISASLTQRTVFDEDGDLGTWNFRRHFVSLLALDLEIALDELEWIITWFTSSLNRKGNQIRNLTLQYLPGSHPRYFEGHSPIRGPKGRRCSACTNLQAAEIKCYRQWNKTWFWLRGVSTIAHADASCLTTLPASSLVTIMPYLWLHVGYISLVIFFDDLPSYLLSGTIFCFLYRENRPVVARLYSLSRAIV